MSEYEYYTNSPYTNFCKLEGWYEKREHEIFPLRFAAWRIHQSLVSNALSWERFWYGERKEMQMPDMEQVKQSIEKYKRFDQKK